MYTDTQPTFRTVATGFAAATVYTALLFAVSASPARAATTDHGFVRSVEAQLNNGAWAPNGRSGVSTVAVRIDAHGKIVSTGIAGSSGDSALDREALHTAKTVSYPATGRARNVAVVIRYGDASMPAKADSARLVGRYTNAKGEALATEIPAPNAG